MADRKDWYFRQIVAEDELDSAFTELEQADRHLSADHGLGEDTSNKAEFGGIVSGLTVSALSGLDTQVTLGTAYDKDGQRIRSDTNLTVSVQRAGSYATGAGGSADGTNTDPTSGLERWVTLFAVFDRILTDQRVDGNDQQVYFERDESFHFELAAGSALGSVGTPSADGSARQDGKILLCDIKLTNPSGSLVLLDTVDTTRREEWFAVDDSPRSIRTSQLRTALKALLTNYNNHVSDTADLHTVAALSYAGGPNWADGTTNPATNVEAQLDKILGDLATTTLASSGTKKIGVSVRAGTLETPTQASPLSVVAGTLQSQIDALQDAVNGRVFRGGDDSIAGDLLPSVTGKNLGESLKRWNVICDDFDITGVITGELLPAVGSQDIGASGNRWANLYADTFDVATSGAIGDMTLTDTRIGVGTTDTPWAIERIDKINTEIATELVFGDRALAGTYPSETVWDGIGAWAFGVNATWTAGSALFAKDATDGGLIGRFHKRLEIAPFSDALTDEFEGQHLGSETVKTAEIDKPLLTTHGNVYDGATVEGWSTPVIDKFGYVVEQRRQNDDFSNYNPSGSWQPVDGAGDDMYPWYDVQEWAGGLQSLGISDADTGLNFISPGSIGGGGIQKGRGVYLPDNQSWMHIRLATGSNISDMKLFAGLSNLDLASVGSDAEELTQNNFCLGLWYDSSESTNWQIAHNTTEAANATKEVVSLAVSALTTYDVYIVCSGANVVNYYIEGMSGDVGVFSFSGTIVGSGMKGGMTFALHNITTSARYFTLYRFDMRSGPALRTP